MNISILLRHSGIWVIDINYEGYKVDGIVVGRRFEEILIVNASKSSKMKVFINFIDFLFYVSDTNYFSMLIVFF